MEDLEKEDMTAEDEIPGVCLAADIRQLENRRIREEKIEAAEKLLGEEKELLRKYEEGEIDESSFDCKYQLDLTQKMGRAATRSRLESTGPSRFGCGEYPYPLLSRFLLLGQISSGLRTSR